MEFAIKNEQRLIEAYEKELLSINQIAEEFDTYPKKISRALHFLKVKIRDKSETQKVSIASGRSIHPTKGKKLSEETKNKIADSVYNSWKLLSENERLERSRIAREQWANMSEGDKIALRQAASDGLRAAAKNGSSAEKTLERALTDKGYYVIFHQRGACRNLDLEVDILLPELDIAIEIDGPSHFLPIWDEEALMKTQKSDEQKNALLLNEGYCVIRVKYLYKNISRKIERLLAEKVLKVVKKIEKSFPKTYIERLIELEV